MSSGFHKLGRISALQHLAGIPKSMIAMPAVAGLVGGTASAALADPGERGKAFGRGLLAGTVGGAGFQAGRHYGRKALKEVFGSGDERALVELAGRTGLGGFFSKPNHAALKTMRERLAARDKWFGTIGEPIPSDTLTKIMLEDPGLKGRAVRGITAGHYKGLHEGIPAALGGAGALGGTTALGTLAPSVKDRPRPLTELRKKLSEFAPGIPSKRPTERLPNITPKTTNKWTVAVQDHEAARAGRHYDLRLVDPDAGKAHSWAIPKAKLPKPGERLLAVQTFTHTPEYALHFGEKKPQVIGKGYGKGSVRMALKEPTDIIEAHNNLVRFNIHQGKDTQKYLLRRTKNDKWLIMNTTKKD